MAIMVAGGLTFAIPGAAPVAYAAVSTSNPHLYVSAEGQDADNQFAQGNIIEVIVRDDSIGDTDEGEAEPAVTINGADLRMLQTANGDWRAYFAQADTLRALEDTDDDDKPTGKFVGQLDYGVFCKAGVNVSTTNGNVDLSDSNGAYFPPDSVTTTSRGECTPQDGDTEHPLIRETRALTDYKDDNTTIGQLGLMYDSLWPFIQVFDFADEANVKIVYSKGGTDETVTLLYDDPSESHMLDREKYPQGAEVLVTIEDYALNIDPTDEDVWVFDTNSKAAYYNVFDEDGNALNIMNDDITDYAGSAGIGEQVEIVRNGQNGDPLIDCQVTKDFGIQDENDASQDYLVVGDDGACLPNGNMVMGAAASTIFTSDSFAIGFVEDGSNNNQFINWAEDQRSNLVVRDDAQRNRSFEIDYNAPGAISGVVGHFFADLTLNVPDDTWNSGERIDITLTDEDANTNPLAENDLTVANPESRLVPSIRIGSPVTLASAGSVTWVDLPDPAPGDTTPPTVAITGDVSIEIIQHINYVDQGAVCENTDGSVQPEVRGHVNKDVASTYTLEYICTDAAGNSADAKRTVRVIEADTTAPIITLTGANPQIVTQNVSQTQNENYQELGATCSDNVDADWPVLDADITHNVDTRVATAPESPYTVTYMCTDTAGNTNSTTRDVIVVDNQDPVITVDPLAQSVLLNSNYADADIGGVTCEDNVDMPTTPQYAGNVDTTTAGDYTVTYTCVDEAGLEAVPQIRTVTVVNHDKPIISISGGDMVEEGEMAVFTVTSFPPSTTPLTVDLNVADVVPSDFVAAGNDGAQMVTIPANTATATYAVQTFDDATDENNGSVSVSITDRTADYTVNPTTRSATVVVEDNDEGLSEIRITNSGDVTEGQPAVFVINANPLPTTQTGDITVTLEVTQDGDFVADATNDIGTHTVTIDDTGVTTLVIPTEDDNGVSGDESDGSITAAITRSDSNYRLSTTHHTSTVAVADNDVGLPMLSIAADTASITEGPTTVASFTITASVAPTTVLTVNLNVQETSDFVLAENENAKTVTILAGETTAMHTVAIADDNTVDTAGTITVTITPDAASYTISSSAGSATMDVTDTADASLPVVSIDDGATVTEGATASFTLTATPAPAATITVNLNVADVAGSDFIAQGNEGTKTVMIGTGGTATYTVSTTPDTTPETNGEITVTIQSGTGYTPSTTNGEGTATIEDDDTAPQTPVVSIDDGATVTEGATASFTLTATPAPAATITVNLNVADVAGSDFIAQGNEGTKTVMIGTGGTATYTVSTTPDTTPETNGEITVTIQSGTGYTPSTTNGEGTATIEDDDTAPTTLTLTSVTSADWAAYPVVVDIQGHVGTDNHPIGANSLSLYAYTPGSDDYGTVSQATDVGAMESTVRPDGTINGMSNVYLPSNSEITGDSKFYLYIDDRSGIPITSNVIDVTVKSVDMTTTPISGNAAGFPPITRAVISNVAEIPAIHNVNQHADLSWTVIDPNDKYACDDIYDNKAGADGHYCVEKFSDRLRLAEPGDISITGDSEIVIDWEAPPTSGNGVTAMFNWDFSSLERDHVGVKVTGVYLGSVMVSEGPDHESGLVELDDTTGMTEKLTIKLNGDVSHICNDITLVADYLTFGQTGSESDDRVNNAIYRIEVEEATPNSADFEATLEYTMLNQLNIYNNATYLDLRTIDSDVSIIVDEDFTDEDSVRINYLDLGADGVSTQIAIQQEAPTHSGVVSFDAENYKVADTVVITLEDADLNVNNDVIDIYTVAPSNANVDMNGDAVGEPGKGKLLLEVTFNDERWVSSAIYPNSTGYACYGENVDDFTDDGLKDTGFTLMETASSSGVFTGSFQVPNKYCEKLDNNNNNMHVESVTGVDMEVNYYDFRDASGEEVEVGYDAAVRANTGTVTLDRTVYPVPFNPAAFGTATDNSLAHYGVSGDLGVHIRVNDADFDVSAAGEDEISIDVLNVTILRGSETRTINLTDAILKYDPDYPTCRDDRTSYCLSEVAPDAGVFEIDLALAHDDGPADRNENTRILQGDIIQVVYTDPTDASGEKNTVTDSATFDLRNAVLQSDKSVYIIGSDMILTLIEPDFDLDNDGAETYPLDLIEWDSDAGTLGMGDSVESKKKGSEAFDPEPNGLRETGDSTGIFQSIIEIPGDIEGDRLERGEEIELEYVDHSPSGSDFVGDETEDINLTVFTSNFGATIELDQKVYTWTDKVYITIVAPDHNFDTALVDEIGESDDDPIRVSTRSDKLDNYKLVETGPDTGIFTGEVILIGFDHNADGDTTTGMDDTGYDNPRVPTNKGSGPTDGFIKTDDDDGITVSFEFSDDETVVGTALIRWNIGEVQWLEASYPASGTGVVRVIDPDMNWNPEAVDNFEVDVWSDEDSGGIDLTVTETNQATGIFEGTVVFTISDESSGHRLRVAEGDTVTAEYEDNTLPDPYTTADELDVTATTLIGTIVPPLERAPASNLRIVDAFENSLDTVSVDQQVQIVADLSNGQDRTQDFAYLVQVQDANGVTVSLAWISGTLEAGQTLSPSASWIPTTSGEYTATAFVWESVDNPTALSPPVTTTITVN